MKDPLGELKDSLAYLFELQKTKVKGKFLNPLVQSLKEALDNYQHDCANSQKKLITAIKKAMPIIEKYADCYKVKQKMDILVKKEGESINWYSQSRPAYCPRFQFSEENLRTEGDFISWLSLKSGQDFINLDGMKQIQILKEQQEKAFFIKLGVYLRLNPEFLINLALLSPEHFQELIKSDLSGHFDSHQVEKAKQHHGLEDGFFTI